MPAGNGTGMGTGALEAERRRKGIGAALEPKKDQSRPKDVVPQQQLTPEQQAHLDKLSKGAGNFAASYRPKLLDAFLSPPPGLNNIPGPTPPPAGSYQVRDDPGDSVFSGIADYQNVFPM